MRNANQVKLMMLIPSLLILAACAPSNQATWSETEDAVSSKRTVAASADESEAGTEPIDLESRTCGATTKNLNWKNIIAPAGLGNVTQLTDDQVIDRTKDHLRKLIHALGLGIELAESKGLKVSDAARESTRKNIEVVECYLALLDSDEQFRADVVQHIRNPFVPQGGSKQLDAKLCAQLKKDLEAGRFTDKARVQVEKDLKENCAQ